MPTRTLSSSNNPHPLSIIGLAKLAKSTLVGLGSNLHLAFRRWQRDDAMSLAAAVSFYLSLSIFPMLLLLTGGLGLVMKHTQLGSDAHQKILQIASEHCSPSLEAKINDVLQQFKQQSIANGPIGFLTTLLAAIGVFYQFERAFDKIWRVPPASSKHWAGSILRIIKERVSAFVLLASVGLGIFAVLLVNMAIGIIGKWFKGTYLDPFVSLTTSHTLITIMLNSLAFGVIFRFLPKRPIQWSVALRGGLLTSVLWEIGRQLLGSFLIGVKYTTAYGAIGSFIGLLLWFYWGVSLLLFGAEYVLVLSHRHSKTINRLSMLASDNE
ncbi:MAG: YihY/virulence factor BrkB family protein [Pirellulales bacterium]